MFFGAIIHLYSYVHLMMIALHLEMSVVIYSDIWIGIRSLSMFGFLLAQAKRYIIHFPTDHGVHSLWVLQNNEC